MIFSFIFPLTAPTFFLFSQAAIPQTTAIILHNIYPCKFALVDLFSNLTFDKQVQLCANLGLLGYFGLLLLIEFSVQNLNRIWVFFGDSSPESFQALHLVYDAISSSFLSPQSFFPPQLHFSFFPQHGSLTLSRMTIVFCIIYIPLILLQSNYGILNMKTRKHYSPVSKKNSPLQGFLFGKGF